MSLRPAELPPSLVDKIYRARRATAYLGEALGMRFYEALKLLPLAKAENVRFASVETRKIPLKLPGGGFPTVATISASRYLDLCPRKFEGDLDTYVGIETRAFVKEEEGRVSFGVSSEVGFWLRGGYLYAPYFEGALSIISLFDNPGVGDLLRAVVPELSSLWDVLEELAERTRVEYSEDDMRFFEAVGAAVGKWHFFDLSPIKTPRGEIEVLPKPIRQFLEELGMRGVKRHDVFLLEAAQDVRLKITKVLHADEEYYRCKDVLQLKDLNVIPPKELYEKYYERPLLITLGGVFCVCDLVEVGSPEVSFGGLSDLVDFYLRNYRWDWRGGRCYCVDASCREAELDVGKAEALLDMYLRHIHRAIWRALLILKERTQLWEAVTPEDFRGIVVRMVYGKGVL